MPNVCGSFDVSTDVGQCGNPLVLCSDDNERSISFLYAVFVHVLVYPGCRRISCETISVLCFLHTELSAYATLDETKMSPTSPSAAAAAAAMSYV